MGQHKSNHLTHYAKITTIHGIKDFVFSRNKFLRLAWGLFLVATMGLLCSYTYDTVKYYLSGPTTMRASTVRLETYPPIHVCSEDWLDDTQAELYNFTHYEHSVLNLYFLPQILGSVSNWRDNKVYYLQYESALKSIRDKMKLDNWSSLQGMMNMLSWNVSVESQGDTATIQKRLLWTDHAYFCQSISNVNQNMDLEIKLPLLTGELTTYIVVGEDLFGEKFFIKYQDCINPNVEVRGVIKRSLLNRPGFECTHDYDSTQACLLDCGYKRLVCNCTGTASTTSSDNISFWIFDMFKECDESEFNNSQNCTQSYNYCNAQCKPCVTWNYHSILTACDFNILNDNNDDDYYNFDALYNVSLRFTKVPMMEVSEQEYSYTPSSMLSYIGGLLGLFCGASVLSFVQAFLFWWGDGCRIGKGKVGETVVEDIAKQDNIQSWVQQATLHIPHCKQCSTVTARNIQFHESEQAQTSQQKTNHLANYAHNTTIHGIQDFLFMKNKLLKLVWGLFLLAVAGLMCEEIYRTVVNYIQAPTARSISIVPFDTYPTIHVCSDTWYDDTLARSYGFKQEELAFIRLAFQEPERAGDEEMLIMMKLIEGNNTAFEEQKKNVQHKMEQHNLKTVRDMLNLITWNLSILGQEFVISKRWHGRVLENDDSAYVCHSISNASAQHNLSIKLPQYPGFDEFIVIGEDPFAESIKYGYHYTGVYNQIFWRPRQITLKIWEINIRSLLGKDGTCNQGYNSFGVCRQDCASKKDMCNCNGTMKIASYENNEDFFLLASRHDYHDDATCNQNYDKCVEMCEPCTAWDYQVTTTTNDTVDILGEQCKMNPGCNDFPLSPLNITMVPRMRVTQEYYTFPVRSLLSNIGGLMGIFCGASVLSLVQLLLFWWDDGCLLCKTKGTKMNNTADHIKTWPQQAALRIPHCELCKKLTSTRTQNKQGGEVKTSQQRSHHLANYAENTTIHGIKDLVFCKNKLIKLAWGLMLLIVFCLMCKEIYRTVKDYASSPTGIDESIILLDQYPPVHACFSLSSVYNDIKANSYGFDNDEIGIIWSMFQGSRLKLNDSQRASIKRRMEKRNLTTVRDMLNIVTVNVSLDIGSMLPDDPAPQKRLRRHEDDDYYVCYTFSNFTLRDGGLIFSKNYIYVDKLFVVIGEDPFGLRYELNSAEVSLFEVFIRESNRLSLINKGGTCSHDYNSSGVCLQDCVSKEAVCNINSTAILPSYENNESFWYFFDRPDYANTTCQHNHGDCTAKCKLIPCTTWTYQRSAFPVREMYFKDSFINQFFKLNMNPNMIVSQEYYTYPPSSLLANIGGLISLFCGGSLLSIVQVILFWWSDGCCRRKGTAAKENTTIVPEDDLHKWIQHVALHGT